MNYRIKIEELNDGTKDYTPQVSKIGVRRGWILKPFLKWENIIKDSYLGVYKTSGSMRCIYKTEEEAIEVIEGYKLYIDKRFAKGIKSITYKDV